MAHDLRGDFQQLTKGGVPVTLDMETAMAPLSFQGRKHVRLLQLLSDHGECWYDLQTFTDADWELLKLLLEPLPVVIGQNLAFDYQCLLGCGIKLQGRLEDTMIQSALLNNGLPNVKNSLESIALRVLGKSVDKSLQKQDWMSAELNDADMAYAMGDVRLTYQAWLEQGARVRQSGLQKVYELECSLLPAVVEMRHTGLRVDVAAATAAVAKLEAEIVTSRTAFIETLDATLLEIGKDGLPRDPDGSLNLRPKAQLKRDGGLPAGFNLNSPAQVIAKLNAIGIEPVDSKTGKATTDKKVLRMFNDQPVVAALLDYKRAEKRRSMIQGWLDKDVASDGRIHANFSPLSTGTGRFSCSKPNLQQVPREGFIRDCFIAGEGTELVVMDVKNMEMGVAASEPIANEERIQVALREGQDLHTLTAHLIFDVPLDAVEKAQRQQAKSCNFGLLYGSGAGGLKEYFASFGHTVTLEEATEFRKAWLIAYPEFSRWHYKGKDAVQRNAEVRMVDGRRRFLPGDLAKPTVWLNNLVQGTAASIVKNAMVRIHKKLHRDARLVAQIHDEVIVETPLGAGEEHLEMMKLELLLAGRDVIGDSVDMVGEGSVAQSWGQAK